MHAKCECAAKLRAWTSLALDCLPHFDNKPSSARAANKKSLRSLPVSTFLSLFGSLRRCAHEYTQSHAGYDERPRQPLAHGSNCRQLQFLISLVRPRRRSAASRTCTSGLLCQPRNRAFYFLFLKSPFSGVRDCRNAVRGGKFQTEKRLPVHCFSSIHKKAGGKVRFNLIRFVLEE